MEKRDRLEKLQEQLSALASVVENDPFVQDNMEDHVTILNALKRQIERTQALPDDDIFSGTKTGRVQTKKPNVSTTPKNKGPTGFGPGAKKVAEGNILCQICGGTGEGQTAAAACDMCSGAGEIPEPPVTNRRAAIQHTKAKNARSKGS